MKAPPWKVGELARNTGMTVRALHHYDEIGLLTPSLRTDAGHRLYDLADIERLQRIHSLRLIGVSLDETRRLLDGDALSARTIIETQLEKLQEQMRLQKRLAERLRAIAHHLNGAERPTLEELCATIEDMMKVEKYFTPEQLETLDQRRVGLGETVIRDAEASWAALIPAVEKAMNDGVDPASPEVLVLARRWKELVNEFTGGDAGIAGSLNTMYQKEGATMQSKLGNVPVPELFAYISKGFAALRDSQ